MATIKLKGATSGSVSLDVPAAVSGGDISLTLPNGVGSAGQYLRNSGTAGTLEFGDLPATTITRADLPQGTILQVLQSQSTAETTVASGSEGNVITRTITPTSATSLFLLTASVNVGMTTGSPNIRAWFRRNTTDLGSFVDGARKGGIAGVELRDGGEDFANVAYSWLDSPATTSTITYAVRVGTEDGAIVLNRVGSTTNSVWATRSYSILTVMEIAA